MRLAIADPPYPAFRGAGGRKQRASRWYGDNQRATSDRPSDYHPADRGPGVSLPVYTHPTLW